MRKFTKEITALIASVAVGVSVGAGTASSEEIVQTAGVVTVPEEISDPLTNEDMPVDGIMMPETTTEPPLAGVPLPPDEYTETSVTTTIPPIAGVTIPITTVPPDETIEPTTEEMPPLIGEPTMPDEYIEETTIEEIPPLAGDLVLIDGDINDDYKFNVADIVMLQNYLTGNLKSDNARLMSADMNKDGRIDVFDLVTMKRKLLGENKSNDKTNLEMIKEATWEIAPIVYSEEFRDTLGKDYIITSTIELADYFYNIYNGIIDCNVVCPENEIFNKFSNKYDYKFFENNVLLMKPLYQLQSNGNVPYKKEGVSYSGDTLCIFYSDHIYGDSIEVFDPYLALVSIPKSMYHAKSVKWVNVNEITNDDL